MPWLISEGPRTTNVHDSAHPRQALDVDSHGSKLLLEQGIQVVPDISNMQAVLYERQGRQSDVPMRRVHKVLWSLTLWPARAKLVRYRSYHPHLPLHLAPLDDFVPALDKGQKEIFVEIDIVPLTILCKVVLLQRHSLLLLIAPSPDTLTRPGALRVFPRVCAGRVGPNDRRSSGGEWPSSSVVADRRRVA